MYHEASSWTKRDQIKLELKEESKLACVHQKKLDQGFEFLYPSWTLALILAPHISDGHLAGLRTILQTA